MSAGRLLAAWAVIAAFLVGMSGVVVYSTGILVRHGEAPSEVLYGWDGVRYLCPRLLLGIAAFTAVAVFVSWILTPSEKGQR